MAGCGRGLNCVPMNAHTYIYLQIVQLEKDKKVAAKTMNKAKINSAVKAIEEYELSKSKYESTHIEFKEKLQGTRHKLQQVEQALKKLKPLLKLDSMQDRCK